MQNHAHTYSVKNSKAVYGFTLIELIVVLIIISIMAVTVLPKFFGSTGYQEYTYQAEVITKLRSIQIRAMQQTDPTSTQCHTIVVTATALGVPEKCDLNLAEGWQGETTSVVIQPEHTVTFDFPSGNFSFDGMGRPSCSSCSISVKGDSTLSVVIEPEGYIYGN